MTWVVPVPHESHGPKLHNFGPHAGAPCTVGEDALMGAHHPGEPCCLEWYPAAAILERMSGSPPAALGRGGTWNLEPPEPLPPHRASRGTRNLGTWGGGCRNLGVIDSVHKKVFSKQKCAKVVRVRALRSA